MRFQFKTRQFKGPSITMELEAKSSCDAVIEGMNLAYGDCLRPNGVGVFVQALDAYEQTDKLAYLGEFTA